MTSIRDVINETRILNAPKGLWYLATPYAKYPFGKDEAARHAAKIAAEFINNGVAVFCPIAHGHTIQTNGGIQGHDVWLGLDELIMHACVGLIVPRMPGWHFSKGVTWEIEWFAKHGIEPLYCDVVEFLGMPEYFNERALSDEAEAKLMDEPQPTIVGVDLASGPDETAHWVYDTVGRRFEISRYEYERILQDARIRSDQKFADEHGFGDLHAEAMKPNPDPREDRDYRKARPVTSGVLDYFPLAIAEIARISALGNAQHNPNSARLHWERTKSNDHADTIGRHLSDRGSFGVDGARHTANLGWRALAMVQEEMEAELLANGVHPTKVFSRAHTWHGKTVEQYWGGVTRDFTSNAPTRAQWEDAANRYWGEAAVAVGQDLAAEATKWNFAGEEAAYYAASAKPYDPKVREAEYAAEYYAARQRQATESTIVKAAVSLQNMVHEWYTFAAKQDGKGIAPPSISAATIASRLDRFFK